VFKNGANFQLFEKMMLLARGGHA